MLEERRDSGSPGDAEHPDSREALEQEGSFPAKATPEDSAEGGGRTTAQVLYFSNEGSLERLDSFLASRVPDHSRSYIQRLIETGYVNFESPLTSVHKPSAKVKTGRVVRLVIPPPLKLRLKPEPIPLDILYEDESFAVINKPPGLSVHPAPDQVGSTLVNALLYWLKDLSGIAGVERPGIVHRLDKDTSGVMVVAKNDRAHHGISAQFKERTVHKRYLAIARGEPQEWEGRLESFLGRSRTHSKKIVIRKDGTGRSSTTDYRVLEVFKGYSLIECFPRTGRTHQIRVHLASIRLPVAADKLYGREKVIFPSQLRFKPRQPDETPVIERHALHATSISFRHPVTFEEMTFNAPLHADMLSLLHGLQIHRSPR